MENKETHLVEGDKAPDFALTDQTGKMHSLQDYRGKKLVLFFYPQDNTPGCTAEACNLRDNHSYFQKKGYQILGISPDSERKHRNFIAKFELPFPLLADVEKKMINDYGLWGPKFFMGKWFEGVKRTTFLIDENGIITSVIGQVKTKEHSDQLKELIEA